MEKKQYKRKYRELNDKTKMAISIATKGKPKSADHKEHISQGMINYWKGVPNQPHHTTMEEYLSGQ